MTELNNQKCLNCGHKWIEHIKGNNCIASWEGWEGKEEICKCKRFIGQKFFEIGCRKCGEGGNWKIFTDGKGNFKAEHSCGYISNFEIVYKPDVKPIDLRYLL